MKVFSAPIAFDWDAGNSQKNQEQHGVTNQEAESLFFNEHKFVFEDSTHSQIKKRYLLLGITSEGRKPAIIFIIRKNKIRIISARDMHKKERQIYDKKTKEHSKI